nr:hypothetical protein [Mitsuokella multacida]
MGHGVFQLGQVDGVCVFTAGSHAGDLTAGSAIADRKSALARLPGQATAGGRGAGLGVPAGGAAGAVCLRAFAQGNGAFHASFGVLADRYGILGGGGFFTNGYGIFFGHGRIADGYGGVVSGGIVADCYGIAAVGGDIGTGGDGVLGRLVELDGIKVAGVVGRLIIVDRLAIFFVSLAGIARDVRYGRNRAVLCRYGMGILVLRRSGRVVIGIAEHMRLPGWITAVILIPGSILRRGSLIAVFVDVVGHELVGDLGIVADGGGVGAFGMALVAYSCRAAGFCGCRELMGFAFTIDEFRIIFCHGLTFRLVGRILAQSVCLSTDGGIILAVIIRTFWGRLFADEQIAMLVIRCRATGAEVDDGLRVSRIGVGL